MQATVDHCFRGFFSEWIVVYRPSNGQRDFLTMPEDADPPAPGTTIEVPSPAPVSRGAHSSPSREHAPTP